MTANTGKISLPQQEFFTPLEVAELLQVTPHTVYVWLRNPDHPLKGAKLARNVIRISRANLAAFLEEKYGPHTAD